MGSLSIVVEGSACAWGKLADIHGDSTISDIIRAVVSFGNAHLSLSSSNKLLLFMFANSLKERLLFNSRNSTSTDYSLMMIKGMRAALKANAESDDVAVSSPLAGVLSHAICHMKAAEDTIAAGGGAEASSSTTTAASTSSSHHFIHGRIVIVSMTSDFGPEHGSLMNIFFSAAKHGICVDVVSLGDSSPLLQQAADITSGMFVQVAHPRQLLSKLMTHVLIEPSARSLFPQPTLTVVDYRASCACHHQLVSSGFVCSVCLSVLCAFVPICNACGAIFKLPRKVLKRKRKD